MRLRQKVVEDNRGVMHEWDKCIDVDNSIMNTAWVKNAEFHRIVMLPLKYDYLGWEVGMKIIRNQDKLLPRFSSSQFNIVISCKVLILSFKAS